MSASNGAMRGPPGSRWGSRPGRWTVRKYRPSSKVLKTRMPAYSRTGVARPTATSARATAGATSSASAARASARMSGGGRRTRLQVGPADELGLALLGKGNLDRVEVARHLGGREDGTRLVAELAAGVARRQVREREQAHVRVARERGGLACGRVPGLARAVGLLVGERRLMDE